MAGAGREIRQTIRLDGEREYSAALQSAQRNLRTLRSALKAETAELGANATAQQKSQVRAQSLQKQIQEQEKIVETLRKALAEAKSKYGDNEAVVAKWEQKLNEALATLAGMQNDLSQTGNSYKLLGSDMTHAGAEGVVAAKSMADSISDISTACENISSGIEGIFSSIISAIKETVTELWDFMGTSAARANNWGDIAGYWGTNAATIQMYSNALSACGKNFDDLNNIVTRLVMGGKGKKIAEIVGVSDVNYENDWDYAIAVMNRASELLKEGQLSDDFWTEIFGEKKSLSAMGILNDWDLIQSKLTKYDADQGGFGMDSDALETMNAISLQMAEIETSWASLKDSVAGGLGTITANLLVNVSGTLDALNDFIKAETPEEREAALENLRTNIEEFFKKLAEFIQKSLEYINQIGEELSKSEDPLVAGFGNLLTKITDAFQWLIDNQDLVIHAINAILGFWLFTKIGALVSALAGVIAKIEIIKGWKLMSGAGSALFGGGSATAANAVSGTAAGAAGGAAAKGFLSKVFAGIATAAQAAAGPFAFLAGSGVLSVKLDEAGVERDYGEFNEMRENREYYMASTGVDEISQAQHVFSELITAVEGHQNMPEDGVDEDYSPMTAIYDVLKNNADAIYRVMYEHPYFKQAREDAAFNGWDLSDGISPEEMQAIIDSHPFALDWEQFAADAAAALGTSIEEMMTNPEAAAQAMAEVEEKIVSDLVDDYILDQLGSVVIGADLPRPKSDKIGTTYERPKYASAIDQLADAVEISDVEKVTAGLTKLAQMGQNSLLPYDFANFISDTLANPILTSDDIVAFGKKVLDELGEAGVLEETDAAVETVTEAAVEAIETTAEEAAYDGFSGFMRDVFNPAVLADIFKPDEPEVPTEPSLPYAPPEYVRAIELLADALNWSDVEEATESLTALAEMGDNGLMPAGLAELITTWMQNPMLTDDDIVGIGRDVFKAIEENGGLNYTTQKETTVDAATLRALPGLIGRAVSGAMSDVRVYMDGTVVGNLVAPAVSRSIYVAMER